MTSKTQVHGETAVGVDGGSFSVVISPIPINTPPSPVLAKGYTSCFNFGKFAGVSFPIPGSKQLPQKEDILSLAMGKNQALVHPWEVFAALAGKGRPFCLP